MAELKSPDEVDAQVEIARIKAHISELADKHFAKGETAYYFSRLGTDLGNDRTLLESLTGVKLAQFVRENLPFEIGKGGSHGNVFYLVAPGATPTAPAVAPPRYAPRFWAAFAVPLQEAEERVINLDTLEFGPRDKIGVGGADVRPISQPFVAPPGHSGSAAETAERISAWLSEQKLDGARFYAQARKNRHEGRSLLDQVLLALNHDQQQRVSLPLDVIKSLSERRA